MKKKILTLITICLILVCFSINVFSANEVSQNEIIEGVNDSKKLTEKKREALFDVIKEKAVAVGVGISDVKVIEEVNILNATKLAMRQAIENLEINPDYVLIDGNQGIEI